MNPTEPAPTTNRHVTDHLANERTFLAWVRTALALLGFGFVLARMGLFLRQLAAANLMETGKTTRYPNGYELVISGIVFLIIGTAFCAWAGQSYLRNRRAIDRGEYAPADKSVLVLTSMVVVGGLTIVAIAVWRMFFE